MDKEIISNKQGIATMILFTLGGTLTAITGSESGQDTWISLIIAMLMVAPIVFVYSRILKIFPGKNLYDILELLYGKIFGKVITAVFVWYSVHLGALAIRSYTEFMQISTLKQTPRLVTTMFVTILGIYFVKSGIEVIGRWAILVLFLIVINLIVLNILSIPRMDLSVLKPILYNGFGPVFKSAGAVFAFPFGETVLFMTILGSLNSKGSTYRVYSMGLIIAGIIIFITVIRNITTLGVGVILSMNFLSNISISLIEIGDFIQRLELLMSITLFLTGMVKIGICIYSASTGFAKLFDFKDYKKIVVPIALVTMSLSLIVVANFMDLVDWGIKIYKYYAFPFQVIIPLIILITAEIKIRSMKNKQTMS